MFKRINSTTATYYIFYMHLYLGVYFCKFIFSLHSFKICMHVMLWSLNSLNQIFYIAYGNMQCFNLFPLNIFTNAYISAYINNYANVTVGISFSIFPTDPDGWWLDYVMDLNFGRENCNSTGSSPFKIFSISSSSTPDWIDDGWRRGRAFRPLPFP